jgi:hypothetical protein
MRCPVGALELPDFCNRTVGALELSWFRNRFHAKFARMLAGDCADARF